MCIRDRLAPFDALALDEPFTGLDRENRDLALACIRETAGDRLVLLVTHDAADAAGSPVVTLYGRTERGAASGRRRGAP